MAWAEEPVAHPIELFWFEAEAHANRRASAPASASAIQ